jgi:hypothetical protein
MSREPVNDIDTIPPRIDTVFALPRNERVDAIADACRDAVLSFLNESRGGAWGKLELALWLTGPYERITNPANRVMLERFGEAPASAPSMNIAATTEAVAHMIETARDEVLTILECLRNEELGASFAVSVLSNGLVAHCEDECGGRGWLPVCHANMSLTDRLLALVAADYLKRPDAMDTLTVCASCEHVGFVDEGCNHGEEEPSGGAASGVAPRSSTEADELSRKVA